jgi:hypothetical protein
MDCTTLEGNWQRSHRLTIHAQPSTSRRSKEEKEKLKRRKKKKKKEEKEKRKEKRFIIILYDLFNLDLLYVMIISYNF